LDARVADSDDYALVNEWDDLADIRACSMVVASRGRWEAFAPLLRRDVLPVADELEQADRQHFDETVLEAFGLGLSRNQLYESLQALVGIRQAATS